MVKENVTEQKICGMDDEKASALILEIYDLAEKINLRFNNCEKLVNSLKSNQMQSITSLINKFSKLSSNFANINSNIQTYALDITKAKNNYISAYTTVNTRKK